MAAAEERSLLHRASHAMFWNATLLPLMTVFNLVSALLIRQYFGLDSGRYDVIIGLVASLMFYPSLGLSAGLTQFAPELEAHYGSSAVSVFLKRIFAVRLLLLVLLLAGVNVFAAAVADSFQLGEGGALLVHLATLLAFVRAINELLTKSLQSLLEHLWANLLQLLQAILAAAALVLILTRGGDLATVIIALIVVGGAVTLISVGRMRRALREVPEKEAAPAANFSPGMDTRRLVSFSLFMYLFAWLNYVVNPAFASPAIAAVSGSTESVALFNAGFQLPLMAVVVVLAGFQGLYRPLFTRLMRAADRDLLRGSFTEVSKVQAVFLIPTGTGLFILVGHYLPLMFGSEFAAATPIALVMCPLLAGESLLNLGTILLTVDQRYRDVVWSQLPRLLVVPPFIYLAASDNLIGAAAVFGVGRLVSSLAGHVLARRYFGVRFPTRFVVRAALPSLVMLAVLIPLRNALPATLAVTLWLTALGVVIVAVGSRVFRVLGSRELELLERAALPGGAHIIRWIGGRR